MKKLEKKLQAIGFSKEKSSVYLILLQEGSCGAARIARILNRPKSSVLDDLNQLAKDGFASRYKKKNAFVFDADPSRIKEVFAKKREQIELMEQRAQNLEAELRTVYRPPSKKPQLEYLEGSDGVRTAFEDTLKEPGQEIIGYGTVEPQLWSVPNLFPEYYSIRAKKRITFRGLLPITPKTLEECYKHDREHLRQSSFIEMDKYTPIEVNVYRNTVSIMSLYEQFAVLIRSKEVAECFRNIFEFAIKGSRQENESICQRIESQGLEKVKRESQKQFKLSKLD